MDKTREFNRVAKHLREIKADPKLTHIPYFADQVGEIIAEFERAFKRQHRKNKRFLKKRLKILNSFKKEAQRRIKNQTVTYDWWVNFNLRLSFLGATEDNINKSIYGRQTIGKFSTITQITDPITVNDFRTHEGLEDTILHYQILAHSHSTSLNHAVLYLIHGIKKAFPERIMFFSTGEFGVMAFNRAGSRSYLVNVSGEDRFAENSTFNSFDFFAHDIHHISSELFHNPNDQSTDTEIEKRLNNILSKSDREKAEFGLFLFQHEGGQRMYKFNKSSYLYDKKDKDMSIEDRKSLLLSTMKKQFTFDLVEQNEYEDILPDYLQNGDLKDRQQFLDEVVNIFVETFFDILVH